MVIRHGFVYCLLVGGIWLLSHGVMHAADEGGSAILTVLPKDAIPAIRHPTFVPAQQAQVAPDAAMIGVVFHGDAHAYAAVLLNAHEIVNDVVGGEHVATTWWPLCATAIVFSRLVEGRMYTFGVSGKLWKNGLVMYDHQTDTLWSGVTGEALQGPLTGKRLTILTAVPKVRWRDWRAAYPQSQVFMSHGVQESTEDQYASYHASRQTGLVPPEHTNAQLQPKDLIMGIRIGEQARAYPLALFTHTPIFTDHFAGKDLVVYRDAASEASAVYERQVDGQLLSFKPGPMWTLLEDTSTGSTWDIATGTAVAGPLTGKHLHRVPHHNSYWFAWVDFYPHTTLFQAPWRGEPGVA